MDSTVKDERHYGVHEPYRLYLQELKQRIFITDLIKYFPGDWMIRQTRGKGK